jgi:hypothetical protein
MNEMNEEKKYLINKSKYKSNNGFIIGFPSLFPANRLAENFATFTSFRKNLEIEEKIMDILKKIRVCSEDDDVKDIDIFFESDKEEENEKEDEEKVDEEEKDVELKKTQKGKTDKYRKNNEPLNKNKCKIKKVEDKRIFEDLKNMFKEYVLIATKAFKDFSYYYRTIDNFYDDYKKYYWKKESGKLYDKITSDIISIVIKNYLDYEKTLINIIDKINEINSNLKYI